MIHALTRPVSPSLSECELTHLSREPIDVAKAAEQHAAYEALLRSLGATVIQVPGAPEFPDAVFIEDTAVVLDEVAIISRPGAESRRDEVIEVARVLSAHRGLCTMTEPATLDGGDVLCMGRTLYVGRSGRTNDEGIAQLREAVAKYGYTVTPVDFTGCLHLKTAATAVDDDTVLLNRAWVSPSAFAGRDVLDVDATEPFGANVLRVGDALVYGSQFPRTRAMLESRGFSVNTVDCAELAKAEGAVTCCSLVIPDTALSP
jgi:dimethylargininase